MQDKPCQSQENIPPTARLGDWQAEGMSSRSEIRVNHCNQLFQIGDILLRVSGVPLSGLSLSQALEILRSSPGVTSLQVRPPGSPDLLIISYIAGVPGDRQLRQLQGRSARRAQAARLHRAQLLVRPGMIS